MWRKTCESRRIFGPETGLNPDREGKKKDRGSAVSMSKTGLVTGAGGFIGSHLTERLVGDGHRVRVFVRYNGMDNRGNLDDLPRAIQDAIEFERGDLKDPYAVRKAV